MGTRLLSSGLARGVVITPLNAGQTRNQGQISVNPARQANTIMPKVLIKVVHKSSSTKEEQKTCKTSTLRDVNVSQVITRDQLIKIQLADDVTDDFDVRYYQSNTIVSIRSPQDVMEVWSDVKKGNKVVLWCDGLKDRNTTCTCRNEV